MADVAKTMNICQQGNAAALYKISGNIIAKPGTSKEIITYTREDASVKYLFRKKYESEDNIIDKVTTITNIIEEGSVFSVKNSDKIQYKKRIICPAGVFKVIPPNTDKLHVLYYGSFLFSLTQK